MSTKPVLFVLFLPNNSLLINFRVGSCLMPKGVLNPSIKSYWLNCIGQHITQDHMFSSKIIFLRPWCTQQRQQTYNHTEERLLVESRCWLLSILCSTMPKLVQVQTMCLCRSEWIPTYKKGQLVQISRFGCFISEFPIVLHENDWLPNFYLPQDSASWVTTRPRHLGTTLILILGGWIIFLEGPTLHGSTLVNCQ